MIKEKGMVLDREDLTVGFSFEHVVLYAKTDERIVVYLLNGNKVDVCKHADNETIHDIVEEKIKNYWNIKKGE